MATNNAINVTASGLTTYDGAGAFTGTSYTNTTFTPTLTFGGGSTGITYTTQVGFYTQIGNLITVSINLVLSSKGSSTGVAAISGLPSAASATNVVYILNGYLLGMTSFPATTTIPIGLILASSSTVDIYGYLGPTAGTITQFVDTDFAATSTIRFNGFYRV
jgi:hypothetical protein